MLKTRPGKEVNDTASLTNAKFSQSRSERMRRIPVLRETEGLPGGETLRSPVLNGPTALGAIRSRVGGHRSCVTS